MRILILCLCFNQLLSQNLVDQILDRNPFDPARGKKEKVEEADEGPAVPVDLPLCDGTLILGKMKYALLSFRVEGKPVFKYLAPGEKANGYQVDEITYDQVVLKQGVQKHTIKLFEQEKKKDRRGGSKKSLAANSPLKQKKSVKGKTKGKKKKKPPKKENKKKVSKVQKKNAPKIIKKTNKKRPKIDF
ncbi:MAG: hypothetical protein CSA81_07525 [Acidobacteria bacterium]|nr:MAG: hypothetical protein CSA81_07525 [Acidobacteriota bacterium]